MNTENLALEKQLCFRLYTLSKTLNKLYAPLLSELELTYPQYLVMLVLWQQSEAVPIKEIGQQLNLDTGTLSPLLKRMEKLALISRKRNEIDERIVKIALSSKGFALKEKAKPIPNKLFSLTGLSAEEMRSLQTTLDKLLIQTKKHLK